MGFEHLNEKGLVLLGCGKMGSAMLAGWLDQGLHASAVNVLDPKPSEWLRSLADVQINQVLPPNPAFSIIAVKPQMMGEALPALQALEKDTVFLSIAAGTSIAAFEKAFGSDAKIIRAMPNTPAAIGQGITALVGNANVNAAEMDAAVGLLNVVGQTVVLDDEALIDAVTAVSGSGPAYVFHLIETMAAAGVSEGLPKDVAMQLAKATVAGAGAYAVAADEEPDQLRVNVTSRAGTTAAALEHLMDAETGFPNLVTRAVKAAADRGRELGKDA